MGTYVNKLEKVLAGTGDEIIDGSDAFSEKFQVNQITFTGIASGTATVKALADSGDAYEDVEGGTIADLSLVRTLIIDNSALEALSITVSGACTVKIKQSTFKDD